MTGSQIDYMAVYRQFPVPSVLLTPGFVMADMNLAFLQTAGRSREELLGRSIFEAFPDNPWDPGDTGTRNLRASLRRVLATAKPDAMMFQHHDVEIPGSPGQFASRYWSILNAPVCRPDGCVMLIVSCGEDVTDRLNRFMSALEAEAVDGGPG